MFAQRASNQFMRRVTNPSLGTRFMSTGGHGVKHVGVVGAGQMGTGIGIVTSRVAGLNVTMIDPS